MTFLKSSTTQILKFPENLALFHSRNPLAYATDGGRGKEMVRSSGGRSFQRRGAVMDMATVKEHEMSSDWRSRKGETG